MRDLGHEVYFFDTMFSHAPEEILPALEKHRPDILVICDDGFNYLTKMCLTNMREAAFKMIQYATGRGATVIVSSSDSTDHYEQYLDEGADFIVLGEPEQTLGQLIDAINEKQHDFFSIPGLAYRQEQCDDKNSEKKCNAGS